MSAVYVRILAAIDKSFLECIQLALAAYPDARVTITDTGLTLHPSRPPVAKLG